MAKAKHTITTTAEGVILQPATASTAASSSRPNPLLKILGHRFNLRDLLEASSVPGEFDAILAVAARKLELDSEQVKGLSDAYTITVPFKLRPEVEGV